MPQPQERKEEPELKADEYAAYCLRMAVIEALELLGKEETKAIVEQEISHDRKH
jgi:hypothetical protein